MGYYIDAALRIIKEAFGEGIFDDGIPVPNLPPLTPREIPKQVDWANMGPKELKSIVGPSIQGVPWSEFTNPAGPPKPHEFGAGVFGPAPEASGPFGAGIDVPASVTQTSPPVPATTPTATPATPTGAAAVGADVSMLNEPWTWAKRNPENALLGLAGLGVAGGAGLYGLYHMYADKKMKEHEEAKKQHAGLDNGLLKAAMRKLADASMRSPTAPTAVNVPPTPAVNQPPAAPQGIPQQSSSMTKGTGTTTGQQPSQQLNQTWRQTAASQLGQQAGGGEQQQGQESQGQ